ncbi:hypothetical protein [Aeromonas veronii]|uniref:hypothetical protein n=1 Tax=Aeromonas veronii TaxID=654 RepID=UPI003D256CA9
MARGNGFTAAALNINIGANSAQLSAAIDKAKAMVQGFAQHSTTNLQKLSKAFSAVGSAAMQMGPHISNAAGTVAKSTSWAVAGLSVYTAAIVANRLEQEKLAKQFNLSSSQMNQLAYMAKYAGQETEDFADALKELSIKAGDAVEGGEKMADTMGVLFDKMGGAKKWVGENDPIKKIYALREAFQQLSLADQVRVADEMGDAGLKLISTLKLTNSEFEMLRKTGAATANAMNTDAIQTLISKFGYLQQVGNDFLTSIVARFSPMFSMICDDWTKKLTSAFESKGGFKEGFESYVDEWADKIFNFLYKTIESVMSFMDSLNNVKIALLNAANSAKGAMGGSVSKVYSDDYKLTDAQAKSEKRLDEHYKQRDRLDQERIAYEQKKHLEYMKENPNEGVFARNYAVGNQLKDDPIYAKLNANIEANTKAIQPLAAQRKVINAEYQAQRDSSEIVNSSKKDGALYELKHAWEKSNKPKPMDAPNASKGKSISEAAYINSQSEANTKAKADLEKSTAVLEAKLESQMKKIQAIRDKFKHDQQANWDKTVNAEKQELLDSFVDAEQIINDHYQERLKTVKKGSTEEIKIQRELNDKKMDLALIQAEAEKQLHEDQQKRYLYDSNKLMKDMREQHEEVMKKLGKRGVGGIQDGTVGQQNQIREETKQLEKEYQKQLDVLEAEYGKQNALYQEMLDKKTEALKAQQAKEAALMAAHGEGIGHDLRRLYTAAFGKGGMEEAFSERQSVVEGYTNAEIGMMKSHSDEVIGNDADAIAQRKQMDEDAQNARMMFMADGMSQITAMGAKNNKALFIAQKAITLAMIAMNTMMGASQAMKLGPEGLPMVPMFYALGAAQAAQVLATTFIQGQAHDGIDYIPADGTWNLQKGERIVDNRLNVRLNRAVEKINTGNYSTGKGNISISMPMHIQGDVVDNGWFSGKLDEHYERIAECVAKYNDDRGVNN